MAALAVMGFTVPPLTGPVVDQAGILSAPVEADLSAKLMALWRGGGSQIAVLTVANLDGLEIEQASIRVVDAWKLGDAKRDDGILLMIAPEERRLRIEVGQGREGDLPDAYARRIIDDVITPHFKQGDYEQGVLAGVDAIVQHTDPSSHPLTGVAPLPLVEDTDARPLTWLERIAIVILIWFLLFTRTGRALLVAMVLSNGRSSGRSGGGGGYSGGGGGFSGGGASGRW